jgi:photosystem II stability/assembly factor-like uncharacterized protein
MKCLGNLMMFLAAAAIGFQSCGDKGTGPIGTADTSWAYLGLGNETITAVALNAVNPNTIFTGSMSDFSGGKPGRLFRSVDGGKNWDTLIVDTGAKYSAIVIDPNSPQTVYASPWGIMKSPDNGKTWQQKDNGMRLDWEHHVLALEMDPLNSNILYAGTGGPFGGGLYKSSNGAESWTWIGDSLSDGVTSIAIDSYNGNTIYAGTAGRGMLWKTIDGGEHWNRTGLGETDLPVDVCVDPEDSKRIYVGLANNHPTDLFPFHGVWKTEDGGNTWQACNYGLPDAGGATKIVAQEKTGDIFIVFSGPTGAGIYNYQVSTAMWKRIGIDSVYDYYYSDLKVSPAGRYLFFGGKGLSRLKFE